MPRGASGICSLIAEILPGCWIFLLVHEALIRTSNDYKEPNCLFLDKWVKARLFHKQLSSEYGGTVDLSIPDIFTDSREIAKPGYAISEQEYEQDINASIVKRPNPDSSKFSFHKRRAINVHNGHLVV
jgi:hypothetical protein